MADRTFTLEEANRLLPELDQALATVQSVLERMRFVRDQLTDLRIVWEDKILDPSCADHAEYVGFTAEFTTLEIELRRRLERVGQLGAQVKDPDVGLVDFPAQRNGEEVYLCWRRGEGTIGFWHSVRDGFAGRKPINQF